MMANRLPVVLFITGLGLGLALAAFGLLAPGVEWPGGRSQGNDVAASVGAGKISSADYNRALVAFAADTRRQITPEDRAWVLERLIEEELLLARAIELDLPRTNRPTRAALMRALMESLIAEATAAEPDDAQLRDYFDAHQTYFATPPRYRVQAYKTAHEAQAISLAGQLRQGRPGGGVPLVHIPDALLPPAKLRDYLGPGALAAIEHLTAGDVSAPLPQKSGEGFLLVHVLERTGAVAPAFEDVREKVAAAYANRKSDEALRDYLTWLKGEVRIRRPALEDERGAGAP